MTTFRYFAYGSNMLTARLSGRCDSASLLTVAKLDGYRLAFSKRSTDGSGKATIVQDPRPGQAVYGAVFSISNHQLETLDNFEGSAYQRRTMSVECTRTRDPIDIVTYFAKELESGLVPYDWYLALVIAGLDEHGIERDYAAAIRLLEHETDAKLDRKQRLAAIEAFEQAGINDYRELLVR